MKKFASLLMFSLAFANVNAQSEKTASDGYNKWSIEASGGFNKPQSPFNNGYFTSTPSPYTVDLGFRYMLNNEFGLKADAGYNSFTNKNNSADFDTKYYRLDLQGVANLGRIMNFETWTNTIGLLGHAGFGVSRLDGKDNVKDYMGNFIVGVTGQIKLTDRVVLTGDFSSIANCSQDLTFDGARIPDSRGFNGKLFTGTIGLNVYLGKYAKHADWTVRSSNADVSGLEGKIADLENQVKTIGDKKPVIVDRPVSAPAPVEKDLIKEMINDKYFSVYFDFNKSTPAPTSTAALDVVLTYLKNNPSSSLDLVGYADQVGGQSEYNRKLSLARANNVKTILEKAGIASSRISVVAEGADTSIAKDSAEARRLARRVTFRLK
jgi:OmpA-OmpF porin, OOP family